VNLMRWVKMGILGGGVGAAGAWLWRYLQPEHSPLVLEHAVVVITGASGGIGRAYAHTFAKQGCRIVLAARRADALEEVRTEIAPYAADVLVVPTDVRDDDALGRLVQTTLDAFGQIDILINNAGVTQHGMLHRESPQDIRALVDTNLASAMALTALALPSMLARGSGWIVNLASVAGHTDFPFYIVYAPVKRGLISFGDTLRRQLDGTGVHVLNVMPSYTTTAMVTPSVMAWVKSMDMAVDTPETIAEKTLDALLKNRKELLFGGLLLRGGLFLQRHFPRLADILGRTMIDVTTYEMTDSKSPLREN